MERVEGSLSELPHAFAFHDPGINFGADNDSLEVFRKTWVSAWYL
jgi:hypothetical protein